MISYAEITTEPTTHPVSIEDIKSHAIIEHNEDDWLIESYLKAAITELDPPHGYLGRAMVRQTITAYLTKFTSKIDLPFPPLVSVTSVKYQDINGAEQTVDSGKYEVVTGSEPGRIALLEGESWPTDVGDIEYPVWVEYVAGYSTVPEGIRLYIMMLVAEMYRQRELSTMVQVKPHWAGFIDKYRFHFSGWK